VEAYFALFDQPVRYDWGGKLSWKIAPIRQAALIVSVGAMSWSGTPAFAGDLGVVVSPAPARWRVQPYLGLRATVTQLGPAPYRSETNCAPTGPNSCNPQYAYSGPTVVLLLAAGVEIRLTPRISLLAEGAPFWDWG